MLRKPTFPFNPRPFLAKIGEANQAVSYRPKQVVFAPGDQAPGGAPVRVAHRAGSVEVFTFKRHDRTAFTKLGRVTALQSASKQ